MKTVAQPLLAPILNSFRLEPNGRHCCPNKDGDRLIVAESLQPPRFYYDLCSARSILIYGLFIVRVHTKGLLAVNRDEGRTHANWLKVAPCALVNALAWQVN